MFKKGVALFCAFSLAFVLTAHIPVTASALAEPMSISRTVKTRRNNRPAPLVSAMFLILAGMGVSMLFEKKE